jgi:hypothetical protein
MGTAKLLILSISLTRNPWPTRLEAEDMVDLVYKKAVQYHDRGSSMGPPSDLTLDHKGARDIVGGTLVILLLYILTGAH